VGQARCVGVFWDFASLYQHPEDGTRTQEEQALFKQGLGGLASLYAHRFTTVFRATRMPTDYPAAFNLPTGANSAAYTDRGWCFTESCWATLTKDFDFSLDLGRLQGGEEGKKAIVDMCTKGGGRSPPLLPEEFEAVLSTKAFTNGETDTPLVTTLYRDAFVAECAKATELIYADLGWEDAQAAQLARVIASGAFMNLERLNLSNNRIGDAGVTFIARACGIQGVLPKLKKLYLSFNDTDDPGIAALADCLSGGALPALESLEVGRDFVGDPKLSAACESRSSPIEVG